MALLYPYQRRWLSDPSRFKIGMFARQTGKTFTTTLELTEDCIRADIERRATRWVILSRGERQAREAITEGVRRHLTAFDHAFTILNYQGLAKGGLKTSALEVAFRHGSRITALPANPDTARGFSANVLLDEFAFHADSRAIWKALFPVVSRGGLRLRVVSTPNGKGNKFHELMTSTDQAWSRHTVTIHQAVAEGLPRDVTQLRAAMADDEAWRQEFELEWRDEAHAWLPFDLIAGCEHAQAGQPRLYQGGPCFIGNDIARRRDLWVAWVIEAVGGVLWTREILCLEGRTFAEQDAALDALMRRYKVARVVMDQTGMGEKPVEDAKRRYGSRIEGVLLTAPRRLAIASAARAAFEDRRLRLPAGDPVLRTDLHKLRMVTSVTGPPRLVADRDGTGHADRAWACFMAIAAAATPPAAVEFEAVTRDSNLFGSSGADWA